MLRWTLYILRRLANLLGDPVDATLCQVFDGGGRKDGDWCPTCQGKMWIPVVSDPTTSHPSKRGGSLERRFRMIVSMNTITKLPRWLSGGVPVMIFRLFILLNPHRLRNKLRKEICLLT